VQALELPDHKTKTAAAALRTLELSRKVLVVDNGDGRNLGLGLRNLPGVTLMPTRDVNAFHLLGHDRVLLSEPAARKFSEALAK
jgi:large subunit ribosomal protein L4